MQKRLTPRELHERGLQHVVVDRSDDPGFFVSSWPIGYGHTTLHGKAHYRASHLSHNSVLVVVLSNEYTEGAWWRLQNMLRYTEDQGHQVALEEMDDMSTMPADAIGIMRACATMLALDAGFEWCFMVDTDVLLEEDTLVKLLAFGNLNDSPQRVGKLLPRISSPTPGCTPYTGLPCPACCSIPRYSTASTIMPGMGTTPTSPKV